MKKSTFIYTYDGSFLELLNVINYLLHQQIIPLNIKDDTYQANLFEQLIRIDIKQDEEIITKIIKTRGLKIFNVMYYLYLSCDNNKELIIYYFWLYSCKYGEKVLVLRNISWVSQALKISKYVGNESHKMKGFLRFQELKSRVLYAEMAPTNNILPLIVKHFKKRLKNEYWLIEDTKRKIIAIYDKEKVIIVDANLVYLEKIFSQEEENIENLWKSFYQTIGIASRKNERCRRNFMPKKYWQYILEVKEEL